MSTRLIVGWVSLTAAGLWLAALDHVGPVTAAARPPANGSLGTSSDVVAEAVVSTAFPTEAKSPAVPYVRSPVSPTHPSPPPYQPTSRVQQDPELEARSEEVRAEQEEQQVINMTRALATSKVRRELASQPLDEARTERQRSRYQELFDRMRVAVRSEVKCTARLCQVTVETGDPDVLAELERFHGETEQKPMTSIDGDPTIGSIRSIAYFVLDDSLLHEMIGPDTTGIFAPGLTE